MYIVGVRAQLKLILARNTCEVYVFSCRDFSCVEIFLRFLQRASGEITGNNIVSDFILISQIHRERCKYTTRAALQKQHLVVVRDVHDLSHVGFSSLDNIIEHFGSVTHLKNGHAGTFAVQEFCLCFEQDLLRKDGRARGEIVNSTFNHNMCLL